MLKKLLRSLFITWNDFASFFHLILPRSLGMRTGTGVYVRGGIQWALANVRNIELGNNVSLGKRGMFHLSPNNQAARIQIGSNTNIGNDFVITAINSVKIGSDCLISYRVAIMDHSHVTGWGVKPVASGLTEGMAVEIGDRCFIGCGVVILPGVKLGANCIVGSNSVVTKSFDAGSVVAGTPARLLRRIIPAKE